MGLVDELGWDWRDGWGVERAFWDKIGWISWIGRILEGWKALDEARKSYDLESPDVCKVHDLSCLVYMIKSQLNIF